jgi:hypothetical protein
LVGCSVSIEIEASTWNGKQVLKIGNKFKNADIIDQVTKEQEELTAEEAEKF